MIILLSQTDQIIFGIISFTNERKNTMHFFFYLHLKFLFKPFEPTSNQYLPKVGQPVNMVLWCQTGDSLCRYVSEYC